MKSRETLIRLKKFQVDEKRRKVAQIETMIAEFDRMAGDLEREIRVEQDRSGIHDSALGEASDDLKKVELLGARDQMREREAQGGEGAEVAEGVGGETELPGLALLRARGIASA